MRTLRHLILAFLVFPAAALAQEQPKLNVVATFSIVGDLVRNIAGEKADVITLVGANSDAHTFEPTPQDNIRLSQAAVIFENGLHFEHWLDKLYAASGSKARRVVLSETIETITNQGEDDPHIWQDVTNVITMVELVRQALIEIDPSNEEYYTANADRYVSSLGDLNHWIIDTLKDIPDEKRKLVTSHDTFGYFAKRYGFVVVATAFDSSTTEASDPSAAQMVRLIEKVKEAGVKTAFVENMGNSKVMASAAADAGIRIAPALYTDSLGAGQGQGDTYIKMMEHNVRIIAKFLTEDAS